MSNPLGRFVDLIAAQNIAELPTIQRKIMRFIINHPRGRVTGGELMEKLNIEEAQVALNLVAMVDRGMVETTEGYWAVPDFVAQHHGVFEEESAKENPFKE